MTAPIGMPRGRGQAARPAAKNCWSGKGAEGRGRAAPPLPGCNALKPRTGWMGQRQAGRGMRRRHCRRGNVLLCPLLRLRLRLQLMPLSLLTAAPSNSCSCCNKPPSPTPAGRHRASPPHPTTISRLSSSSSPRPPGSLFRGRASTISRSIGLGAAGSPRSLQEEDGEYPPPGRSRLPLRACRSRRSRSMPFLLLLLSNSSRRWPKPSSLPSQPPRHQLRWC
mmetsp:Transcript_21414/g.59449  ORF Transcript_21414/g.59449 Transcript_21414/m.59449 type:complete len:222 (-) Transcript_21414:318-983(-)